MLIRAFQINAETFHIHNAAIIQFPNVVKHIKASKQVYSFHK